jgi:hypothetical protein
LIPASPVAQLKYVENMEGNPGMDHPNFAHNPFSNHLDTSFLHKDDTVAPVPASSAATNPFSTPYVSRPGSAQGSTSGFHAPNQSPYFRSRRVKKGTVERPWLEKKDPKEKWVTIIPLLGIFTGLVITALLIWDGLRSVVNHHYCSVLKEEWKDGFDPRIWTKEVELGGFG